MLDSTQPGTEEAAARFCTLRAHVHMGGLPGAEGEKGCRWRLCALGKLHVQSHTWNVCHRHSAHATRTRGPPSGEILIADKQTALHASQDP